MVSQGMDLVTVLIFLISVFVPSMYLLTGTFIDHVIFYYLNQLLFGHCENVGNGKSLNNPKKNPLLFESESFIFEPAATI